MKVLNDQVVIRRIERFPAQAQERVVIAIRRLAVEVQGHVKANKLTGQVLKVRTGTLRRSINQKVFADDKGVYASVGTNVEYAGRHEFGFVGTGSVREHVRTIKQAFGRAIPPTAVTVSSHSRQVNAPARSFLRSALADKEQSIRSQLSQALSG